MENTAQQLHEQVHALSSLVNQLQEHLKTKAIPVSQKVRDSLANFHQQYVLFSESTHLDDVDVIIRKAQNVAVFGKQLSQLLSRMMGLDSEMKTRVEKIGEIATKLRKVDDDPSLFRPLEDIPTPKPSPPAALPSAIAKRIEQFMLDQEKQDERVKRSLAENEKRSTDVRSKVEELESQVAGTLLKVQEKYDQTLVDLRSKEEQINSILGHASGRVIAGDYEKSAATEKAAADWLRWASLLCMALIAAVLGYSFWETTATEFHWQKSLFRVALAFLLSAPAAYLARESSKHRVQQYQHHQTSLDLKAIAPYLASLPDDVQHKIKSDVAAKLFAGRDLSHVGSESYPVNTHELLMELAKRLPMSTANEKV